MTTSLRQQAQAIDTVRRILVGSKLKPRGAEIEMLQAQLSDASRTMSMFAERESAIRQLFQESKP